MLQQTMIVASVGCALALAAAAPARAAEIRVMSSNALKTALQELAPMFEQETGHKLVFTWGAGIQLKGEIEKGASFDATVLNAAAIDDLIKQGKLVPANCAVLAYSGMGVAVRKGAPKPDISTIDAFKHALLAAKSVAFVEQGATGIYMKKTLLPRLGIAEAIEGKIKLLPPENPAAKAVANGEAEIGMTQISEILPYAGAELVGPLPLDIQRIEAFAIALGANGQQSEAAISLMKYVTAPAAASVFKAKGLEAAAR